MQVTIPVKLDEVSPLLGRLADSAQRKAELNEAMGNRVQNITHAVKSGIQIIASLTALPTRHWWVGLYDLTRHSRDRIVTIILLPFLLPISPSSVAPFLFGFSGKTPHSEHLLIGQAASEINLRRPRSARKNNPMPATAPLAGKCNAIFTKRVTGSRFGCEQLNLVFKSLGGDFGENNFDASGNNEVYQFHNIQARRPSCDCNPSPVRPPFWLTTQLSHFGAEMQFQNQPRFINA